METTAPVTISAEQKLRNLRTALDGLHTQLRREGRYVSSDHVQIALTAVAFALDRSHIQAPGHD